MTSANRVVQVVLVVLLATLCKKYFELQEKYEDLKVACETSCFGNLDQSTDQRNGKSKQIQRLSSTASVFMHSSTRNDKIELNDEGKGFLDVNEPTFYNDVSEQDVTLTSPGHVVNTVAGIVHQTSNILDIKPEIRTEETLVKQNVVTHMDSTKDDAINPSENNFHQVDLTEKDSLGHTSLGEVQKQSSLLSNDAYFIKPSETTYIHKSLDDTDTEEKNFQIGDLPKDGNFVENEDKTYDSNTMINREHDSNLTKDHLIKDSVELVSSDSTEEKNVFVLQTSVEEIVNEDPNVYNVFDTDESTPVINTGLHGDVLHVMTDSTGYAQEVDDINCDDISCHEFYDDEDDDVELSVPDKDEKKTRKETTLDYITIPDEEERHQFIRHGTSAQCHRETQNICQFQNICYNTKEKDFVFFKGEKSNIENDLSSEESSGVIFDINLSTIHGHNAGMLSIVTLPGSLMNKFSVGIVNKKSFAIKRFKPDNIMHVLHDDILPLFQTLNNLKYPLFGNRFDVAIIFTDNHDNGNYFDLYSSLSTVDPISPWQHNKTYDLLCFPSLHVGLETSTVWYQYGFFQPQGPVSSWKNDILENIHTATDKLSLHFKSDCFLCSQGNYLVLLSRKDNRLILNEGELIMSVTKSTRLKIMSVSLETHSLSDIISTIRLSRGVIGMHGSLLSLIVFLPPGSIVIELFPFAVNPSHYTPFKTFCDLPGSALVYQSWANPSLMNSVPHPDRPASEGGIRHLPKNFQSEITSESDVPIHLCCDNPSWLYHIYQDTIVDINAVVTLILGAIRETENLQKPSSFIPSVTFLKDIPGSVRNLQCETVDGNVDDVNHVTFVVSWDIPWVFNYDATALKEYNYEIVIQKDGDEDSVRRFELPAHDVSYRFESTAKGLNGVYNVWLSVMDVRGNKGQSKFVRCS